MKDKEAIGLEMVIFHEGEYQNVTLDMVEEIRETSILFYSNKDLIEVDAATANIMKSIVKENAQALFAINSENRVLILDYEVPETQLIEELEGGV